MESGIAGAAEVVVHASRSGAGSRDDLRSSPPSTSVSRISRRAARGLQGSGFASYFKYIPLALADPWTLENQDGYVNLSVAANVLLAQEVRDKLSQGLADVPVSASSYGPLQGLQSLREQASLFMNSTFMAGVDVRPEELLISCGTTATLDLLYFSICEEGEAVLIPTPCYVAFERDLTLKATCSCIHVHPSGEVITLEDIETAYQSAQKTGAVIKSLLLTNPNNPNGSILKREELKKLIVWALTRRIHVVSDEIYAASIFDERSDNAFVSAGQLAVEIKKENIIESAVVDNYLHVIYGLSKDFCMNGYRIGILWTRNSLLMNVLAAVNASALVPNNIQHAAAALLSDREWVTVYLRRNLQALNAAYTLLGNTLRQSGIPFQDTAAGMFLWLDLRSLMKEESFPEELALADSIVKECKIVMAPGQDSKHHIPGFFRVCFAAATPQELQVVGERLSKFVGRRRLTV